MPYPLITAGQRLWLLSRVRVVGLGIDFKTAHPHVAKAILGKHTAHGEFDDSRGVLVQHVVRLRRPQSTWVA